MKIFKKTSLQILFVFFSLALATTAVYGGTYYVNGPSGNDSNPGTMAAPWKTISKAATSAQAGDTIVVNGGTYGERVTITKSGTAGSVITYVASGTVACKGFTIRASYITVDGFNVEASDNNSTSGRGFYVSGISVSVKNCYVTECPWGGIFYDNNSSSGYIFQNRCYHNGQNGIEVWGSNHLVESNEIWESVQNHPKGGPTSGPDADGVRFHGDHHVFRANWIHEPALKTDPYNSSPHIDCFQTYDDAASGKPAAQDCIFERNHCRHYVSGMFTFMIEGSASRPAKNIMIRNNLFEVGWGVNCAATGVQNLSILNNTFIGNLSLTSSWPLAMDIRSSSNVTIENNITVDYKGNGEHRNIEGTSGLICDYNCAWNSDGSAPGANPGKQGHEIWAKNPLFVNFAGRDFHLQAGSPCVDAGTPLPLVSEDAAGAPRPSGSGYDIGAYELQEGGAGTLHLTAPNGGESLAQGSTSNISWNSTGLTGTVNIELDKAGSYFLSIGTAPVAAGTFSWTVPLSVPLGGDYRVRIYQGSVADDSDGFFGIAAPLSPFLQVVSPNGGESWRANSLQNIGWLSSGGIANVKIEYSTDGGANYSAMVVSTPNDGSYSWTVPDVPSSNCLVKISDVSNPAVKDESDALFSITVPQFVKDDLVGTWDGQGVYCLFSGTGQWLDLATPADSIASGDLTGDGKDDLIGNWGQSGVWIKSSADGNWTYLSSGARAIAVGDMNGDGRPDFLGTWDDLGVFYRNSATGAWIQSAPPATLIAAGDLDGDGKDDLIGIWPGQTGLWMKSSQTGKWSCLGSSPTDIATGDMNGDGRKDVVGTWGQGVFYRNSITGQWVRMALAADKVAVGDLDGDGREDLIGIWPAQGGVWVKYSSTGAWSFLGPAARDITAGHMAGAAWSASPSASSEITGPEGRSFGGPSLTVNHLDLSAEGPGGMRFVFQSERDLIPGSVISTTSNIPAGPGQAGFRWAEQENIWPH